MALGSGNSVHSTMNIARRGPRYLCLATLGLSLWMAPAAEAGMVPQMSSQDHKLGEGAKHLRKGDASSALRYLTAVIPWLEEDTSPTNPLDHARYLAALAAWRSDDPRSALHHAQKVRSGKSRRDRDALLIIADVQQKLGQLKPALKSYEKLLKTARGRVERRHLKLIIASLQESLGDHASAVAHYRELWQRAPARDVGQRAAQRLTALAKCGVEIPEPSQKARLGRIEALLASGHATQALGELSPLLSVEAGPDLRWLEARVLLAAKGRAVGIEKLAVLRNRRDAGRQLRADATWLQGRTESRRGNYDAAVGLYRELLKIAPRHDEAATAAFFEAWLPYDSGDYETALKRFEKLAARGAKTPRPGQVGWFLGWLNYRLGRLSKAAKAFERLAAKDRDQRERARYWQARTLEQIGGEKNAAKAAQLYARVNERAPLSYYGALARRRAGGLTVPPPATKTEALDGAIESPVLPRLQDGALPMRRAARLLAVGMKEGARLELGALTRRRARQQDAVTLSRLYFAAGQAQQALRTAARALRHSRYALPDEKSLPLFTWLFPAPWRAEVQARATEHEISPSLVWAVMRQESLFDAEVRSGAGALGLLQLMPATGAKAASRAGVSGLGPGGRFETHQLLDPATNIALGSWYLSQLLAQFNGQVVLAVAAYNAGPAAVGRWLERKGKLPLDAFVEEIPYRETRRYTRKVLSSAAAYDWIYGVETPAMQASAMPWKLRAPKRQTVDF